MRYQARDSLWLALGGEYGSGLPVELEGDVDEATLVSQYGAAVVDRVNLERGRVRPNFSLDASAGAELYRKEKRTLSLEVNARNLTGRLNVINFASLFSGTGIGEPRNILTALRFSF